MNANSDTAWKSPVLVYDIEKSNRDCMPVNRIATLACRDPDLILRDSLIPPLWFESRFECGNLRQARRMYVEITIKSTYANVLLILQNTY